MIRALTVAESVERWDELGERFDRALEFDPYQDGAANILAKIAIEQCLILDVNEGQAVIAMEVSTGHEVRSMNLVACEGEGVDDWLESALFTCEEIARSQQCDFVSICGRVGWRRKIQKLGYREISTILRKSCHG